MTNPRREVAEAGQELGALLERAADAKTDDRALWRAIAEAGARVVAAAQALASPARD